METRGKTNKILENKLEELECLLEKSGLGDDGDLNAFDEIQHRFIFTQTLLSAEISSVREGEEEKSFELACMAKRLTKLEEAFNKQWTGSVELSQEECQDAVDEPLMEDVVVKRKIERIKRKRFRGLVSFGIVGFVAGMVSFYSYVFDLMKEKNTNVLTPT